MRWLHHYTKLLTAASLVLIAAGGLVTSTGSGLAVPDWPNTYGYFMFSFPLSKMVGGILYEHGHRLIASIVGMLTIGLVIWLARTESRVWVRRLGWLALATVITQGTLGGLTVLYFLPPLISISHAGLAQLFFVLVVSLTVFTSPGWRGQYGRPHPLNDRTLSWLTRIIPFSIYCQILIGATMRHTDAGLAIPEFPLPFGLLIPPVWTTGIAFNFAHRVGALVVTVLILATVAHVLYHHRPVRTLARPALLLGSLVCLQFSLGALTVLSQKQIYINTAHVAVGATVLVTSVALALRVHRMSFRDVEMQRDPHEPCVGSVPTESEAQA